MTKKVQFQAKSQLGRFVIIILLVLVSLLTFAIHDRFILQHFSNGPYIYDSGLYAYFLGSGDISLQDPAVMDGWQYYDYHLYVYAAVLGAVLHALGISGPVGLALHQGLLFSLLFASLAYAALSARRFGPVLLLLSAIFAVGAAIVLEIASFPHLEIAIPVYGLIGGLFLLRGRVFKAALAFTLCALVREDGGFYAAYFALNVSVLCWLGLDGADRGKTLVPGLVLTAAGIAASLSAFAIKLTFFPHVSLITFDLLGSGWDRLTFSFLRDRILGVLTNWQYAVTLVTLCVLGAFSWTYLLFFALALPLLGIQLLAANKEMGAFTLYYAIPWLLVWIGIFLVASLRARKGQMISWEIGALAAAVVLTTGPVVEAAGQNGHVFVLRQALYKDTTNIPALAQSVANAITDKKNVCVSQSVAGLAPNLFQSNQAFDNKSQNSDLRIGAHYPDCRFILNFRDDLFHGPVKISAWLANLRLVGLIDDRIEIYE